MGSKRKSKFSNKNSERIASIRESDSKINIKAQLEKSSKNKISSRALDKKSISNIDKEMPKNTGLTNKTDKNSVRTSSQVKPRETSRTEKTSVATATASPKKKTAQQIREEMLRKLGE